MRVSSRTGIRLNNGDETPHLKYRSIGFLDRPDEGTIVQRREHDAVHALRNEAFDDPNLWLAASSRKGPFQMSSTPGPLR